MLHRVRASVEKLEEAVANDVDQIVGSVPSETKMLRRPSQSIAFARQGGVNAGTLFSP
jgi:hypothetical protein